MLCAAVATLEGLPEKVSAEVSEKVSADVTKVTEAGFSSVVYMSGANSTDVLKGANLCSPARDSRMDNESVRTLCLHRLGNPPETEKWEWGPLRNGEKAKC